MTGEAGRRFLIAAGTDRYDDGGRLPSVSEDLGRITDFFGRLGYRAQLPEVRHNPSSGVLRKALSHWLNDTDRRNSDTAVIYYSGHGDSQASFFYLLTADSTANRYADTAVRTDFVLEALGENPKVRRLLLILDTCYAGLGAFNAAEIAGRMSPWQALSADDEGVWIVAAASPKQEAEERVFVEAFLEAAEQLQQATGTLQPYIGLEALIWQINTILRRRGKRQRVSWIPVTQARGLAPFIPNTRYDPDAPASLDLETREWLRHRQAAELAEHWDPKARGVEVAAQAGWYFTGRRAVLAELTRWIATPDADARMRVVTGDPGSGKSAVLGRLVTLADASSATKPPADQSDLSSVPPVGSIAAALLARGKTADELLAELKSALGLADRADLAGTLPARLAFTVVIDALDEAKEPAAIVEKVILPLNGLASPGQGPRVLVASRRYRQLLDLLPDNLVTIDLDQESWRSDTDTADYVEKVLLAADDPESPTPYRHEPELARLVAGQVAAIAGRSFLIAQIATRTLARSPRVFDPAELAANRERWRDVGAAFDRDLNRYGENARRVRALLLPLAWAEGVGLPRELWASLATALDDGGDEEYGLDDTTWLLEQAGFYLVESLDQDRSVYRLYHEQFAEHLRAGRSMRSIHARITTALLRHVPEAAGGRREWMAATPYISSHLATHAARARMLDSLVNDPGFLLAADPARLLPVLGTVTDRRARKAASAFESAQHVLADQPAGQAAAQLELAARACGAIGLADGISHLPYARPWSISWGSWASSGRHIVLGKPGDGVRAVTATTLDALPVAVTGASDGFVRTWDLLAGIPCENPQPRHHGGVNALSTADVDGIRVVVTGGRDGTVRAWILRTGRVYSFPLRGHIGEVQAVATAIVGGAAVAVTGGRDGTVRVWDLKAGTARGEPLHGHRGGVDAIATAVFDGVTVAVTGGRDGTVRVWDLSTGTSRCYPLRGHDGGVFAVATGTVDGTPVAVTGGRDGTVRVWDLRAGAARGEPLTGHIGGVYAVAVTKAGRVPIAITGGRDGTVRAWDLKAAAPRGEPLRGHTAGVFAAAATEVNGSPVAVTGSSDGTVRAWNLRGRMTPGTPGRSLAGSDRRICVVATANLNDRPVAVTGSRDGTICIWDARTGTRRRMPPHGHSAPINAVATGMLDDVLVAVTASSDGNVFIWNIHDGTARGEALRAHGAEVHAIAIADVAGVPLAITGRGDGTLQIWDMRSAAARRSPLRGHAGEVFALTTGTVGTVPVAVSGGRDGTVRVWDLKTGAARGNPMHGHAGEVFAVAAGTVATVPLAVSGGRDGTVRVWDLKTGAARGYPLRGHAGCVTALAVGAVAGLPVVVSGDDKGTILVRHLGRDRRLLTSFDALADITSIAANSDGTWATVTRSGNLFCWRPAPELRHRSSS